MNYRKGIIAFWLGVTGFATAIGVTNVTRVLGCGLVIIDEEPAPEPATEAGP